MNSELQLLDVTVDYGPHRAVSDTCLEVAKGEVVALLGPSGCGKSSLLRAVAGLEPLASGSIWWRGRDLAEVPVHKRNFGLMFQDHALFGHRNVAENVGFALKMAKADRVQARSRVSEMLELVGLGDSADRSVGTLSGGESQRVALARALAPRPDLLLLDEPLGSLDTALRERLAQEIRSIVTSLGITAIHVTHDRDEAATVSDRLALMEDGRMIRTGTSSELTADPGDVDTARALGIETVLSGVVSAQGRLRTPFGEIAVSAEPGTQVHVLLRPSSLRLARSGVAAEVSAAQYRAGTWLLRCFVEGGVEVVAEHDRRLPRLSKVSLQAQLSSVGELGGPAPEWSRFAQRRP